MKFVLVSANVVLQEHLNLLIHLMPNIVTETARDNGAYTKTQRA